MTVPESGLNLPHFPSMMTVVYAPKLSYCYFRTVQWVSHALSDGMCCWARCSGLGLCCIATPRTDLTCVVSRSRKWSRRIDGSWPRRARHVSTRQDSQLRSGSELPAFDPAGFPAKPPVCYRAIWQLPGPDSHRQATTSLRPEITYTRPPPICWSREKSRLVPLITLGVQPLLDVRPHLANDGTAMAAG